MKFIRLSILVQAFEPLFPHESLAVQDLPLQGGAYSSEEKRKVINK